MRSLAIIILLSFLTQGLDSKIIKIGIKMSVEVTVHDSLTVKVNVEIFYNISNLVKESALLTAFRWSIQIYEKKKGVS